MSFDRSRYLTIKEAAARSEYDYEHLRKLVKEGAIASLEISERVRLVDWEDLQRYLAEKPQRKPHKDKKKKTADQAESQRTPQPLWPT